MRSISAITLAIVTAAVCHSAARAGGPAAGVEVDPDAYSKQSTADDPNDDHPGVSSRDIQLSDRKLTGQQSMAGDTSQAGSDANVRNLTQSTKFSNPIPNSVIQWSLQNNVYREDATSSGFSVPLPMTLQSPFQFATTTAVINYDGILPTAPMAVQAWYGNNIGTIGNQGWSLTAEGSALRDYLWAASVANDAQQVIRTYTTALQMPESDNRTYGVTPQQESYMRQSIVNAQSALTIATDNMAKFTQNNTDALNLFQLLMQPGSSPPPAPPTQTAPADTSPPGPSTDQNVDSGSN
ncbi:hypothetical protein [Mesorhizobium sp.]|uniref:hypothetical protein n=1 Tax=Mesorhizobium sp. TaxID=1871066 RepID=UPI0025D20B4E|nr:hypothetical protein [Mesorhizobium sp.]